MAMRPPTARTEIDFTQVSTDVAIPIVAAPYGSIKGRLDTAGRSVDEYEVVLLAPDAATAQIVTPDAQARFLFPELRPGRYRVGVYRSTGDRPAPAEMQEIDVASGSAIEIEFGAIR